YSGQVKYCYESELKNKPSLAGRVEVSFTVTDGRVVSSSVFGNTTGSDSLGKCIAGKVRSWRFDGGTSADIIYPFILTPSN
ncbi:MAG: AgmX/PglI C-terminal domain-containing protein, partial [Proteobacteria bacterium]|nr:AgmX/PglI C-terminal domain-containing protein [Pseudomonadota bacterium]